MSEIPKQPRRISPWSIWLIIIMVAGGLFVYSSWISTLQRQAKDERPMLGERLETNLDLVNQFGEKVTLGDLKGKVYLANYVFTRCPGQCAGVSNIMKESLETWKGHPLFRLASISLDPAHDTAEDMLAFSKEFGLESKQWWFLTGDEREIDSYMRRYFKFNRRLKSEEEKENPEDLFAHDPLIALVDHGGHIRGIYNVYDELRGEQFQERLKSDLEKVMLEAMDDIPVNSLPVDETLDDHKVEVDIALQRQDGADVKFSDLDGKVTLLSHVFTRCPYQCPGICAALNEIRKENEGEADLMLASFTMDPEHDTPEVLKEFGEKFSLGADNWWFLTGQPEELTNFMADELRFGQQLKPEADRTVPDDIYNHDWKVALMDRDRTIREWYDFSKEEEIEKLKADLKAELGKAGE